LPFREFVISLDKADNVDLGVNDTALLLEAATFTSIRDPYDRMIIAQARVAGVPLIIGDEKFRNPVWFVRCGTNAMNQSSGGGFS
jgi:PIN domain nuclease of toxin-antitoxin system